MDPQAQLRGLKLEERGWEGSTGGSTPRDKDTFPHGFKVPYVLAAALERSLSLGDDIGVES